VNLSIECFEIGRRQLEQAIVQ